MVINFGGWVPSFPAIRYMNCRGHDACAGEVLSNSDVCLYNMYILNQNARDV